MSIARAVLSSWTFDPWLCATAALTIIVYLRGWIELHRQMPERFPFWRLAAFVAGIGTLIAAVASPLDAFAGLLLQVHMVQHLLLMVVAPALIWFGAPTVALLRGLPLGLAKTALGPFLASAPLRRVADVVTSPAVCWTSAAAATCLWHLPSPYQLALRSPGWHALEHGCFFAAGLLFWFPVVQPWPSVARWPAWAMIPYLLFADLLNTILAALLTFSDRVIYPFYAAVPRLNGIAAFDDQVAAGAIMWVPMSLAYLIPAGVLTMRWLSPAARADTAARGLNAFGASAAAARRTVGFDLLSLPALGSVLRARAFRPIAQGVSLFVALAVIVDGFLGPQVGPMNLAGVLPWTHWRGLTVIALLVVGNVFCMACPFTLPRAIGRRLGLTRWTWPGALRSKWLAVALLLVFFWAYEVLAVWDSPRASAWLIICFFAAAFCVDALFRGASFCKYVCPIGQFHFVQSLVSPFEVKVRQPDACARCTTHDCVAGNAQQRGCELDLFLPRKVGNLDCTFCLDCVRACPHDNIGIIATPPGRALVDDRDRSSLGRLSRRPDIAALVATLVFGAFVTAATMTVPVAAWIEAARHAVGASSLRPVTTIWLLGALVVAPLLLLGLAAGANPVVPVRESAGRFILALVPLGAAMWGAHFLLHFVSGWRSAFPVVQRAVADAGFVRLADPSWNLACPVAANGLLSFELVLLDAGLLLSLYIVWRIARSYGLGGWSSFRLLTPWVAVTLLLYVSGVWTFFQPMQMRGLMGR